MIIFIIIWLICGILAFGLDFAYWQRAYPTLAKLNYKRDLFHAFIAFLFGPIGLLTQALFLPLISFYGYQGFKYW